MISFFNQLKWQFVLLQKNSIISISFAVTLIYGIILYLLKDINNMDKLLVSLILNDPSVIGFFFVALAFYTEIKHQIISAVLVTPVGIHRLLITKTIAISVVGVICSLGLAVSVRGFDLILIPFLAGSLGICLLSTLLGIIMLTYASEFLLFAMKSVPVFMAFAVVPMLQYLGAIEIHLFKYLFPIQGSLDLIDYAISGTSINYWYSIISILLMSGIFYHFAFLRFNKTMVQL